MGVGGCLARDPRRPGFGLGGDAPEFFLGNALRRPVFGGPPRGGVPRWAVWVGEPPPHPRCGLKRSLPATARGPQPARGRRRRRAGRGSRRRWRPVGAGAREGPRPAPGTVPRVQPAGRRGPGCLTETSPPTNSPPLPMAVLVPEKRWQREQKWKTRLWLMAKGLTHRFPQHLCDPPPQGGMGGWVFQSAWVGWGRLTPPPGMRHGSVWPS